MGLSKKQAEEFNKIRAALGEAVYPSKEECDRIFKERNAKNSIYWVYNIKEDSVTHKKGFNKYLGYPENMEVCLGSMSNFIPKDRINLFYANVIAAYKVMLEYEPKENLKKGLIYFEGNKVVYDINGNKIYTHQSVEPFQFDKNGNMVSNISWYHIKEGFKGKRAFQASKFITNGRLEKLNLQGKIQPKEIKNIREMKSKLTQYKIELIEGFPFTKTEQLVISKLAFFIDDNMDEERKNKYVAEALQIDPNTTTMRNHRNNIKRKATDFFNKPFSSFKEVLICLEDENLILY